MAVRIFRKKFIYDSDLFRLNNYTVLYKCARSQCFDSCFRVCVDVVCFFLRWNKHFFKK